MKKIKEIIEAVIIFGTIFGTILLPCVIAIALVYLIATSDLPDWFKFWLLK